MKELPLLVLLSSTVLLCSAAPVLELVTCSEDSGAAAARLAMHHINEHHEHGYKFRLNEKRGYTVEKVDNGCNVTMQLDLLETTCHVFNPKHFEDCELRTQTDRAVMANCTVMMTVRDSDAKVTKYECSTRQVLTNREMVMMCPDCPSLIQLNSSEGIKSVHEGVTKFNQNNTNQHYFILKEVGRIKSGYMMMAGMNYYAEFVLVETHCPRGSRIIPEACKPLCPDRAHHAFCRSSYSTTNRLQSVECEFYPPSNTTSLGPGEKEPECRFHQHRHGPPSDADGHGRPPHAGGRGHHTHNDSRGHHSHDGGRGHHTHNDSRGHHTHNDSRGQHTHDGGRGHHTHNDSRGHHSHDGGRGHHTHNDSRGHHTHDGGKRHHSHDGGRGHPPHADGGRPPHTDGKGRPPHAGGGASHPHADGGRPSHTDGKGRPPHAHGPPPDHDRFPFNSYHPLKRFHTCHRSLTNSDPALHPICPWPQHEYHRKPKPTQS